MSEISKITELRLERAKLYDAMVAVVKGADARFDGEGKPVGMTAEDEQELDRIEADLVRLDGEVDRREKVARLKPRPELLVQLVAGEEPVRRDNERLAALSPQTNTPEYRGAFLKAMAFGTAALDSDEERALSVGTTTAGGYTVPTDMAGEIVALFREFGVMRQISNVFTTAQGTTLNIPKVAGHGAAAWVAEAGAFAESDMSFGTASLSAYKAGQLTKVSTELLQDSAFDAAGLLTNKMAEALGVLLNTAYVVGDGSSKPTGITTQTTAGKTGATGQTVTVKPDDLVDLYHSIVSRYRPRGTWVMVDASVAKVRKIVTGISGDLSYIWQPGLIAGQPDTLLGRPVLADPDVAVMAANAKSILFGDFSGYWIRDAAGVTIQRVDELYAATGQVGFIGQVRTDGKLIDTAAVKHYANSAT